MQKWCCQPPCAPPARQADSRAGRFALQPAQQRQLPFPCGRPEAARCACQSLPGEASFAGGSGSASFAGRRDHSAAPLQAPVEAPKKGLRAWLAESRRLRGQLQSYGVAGLLAYGLLNTLWYSGAFLVVWLYIAKVPRGIGLSEAAKQFVAVVGITWAGSQVTKAARAALAAFLAPVADGCLIFLQARLRLRRRRNAALAIVAACLALVALLFSVVVMLWA